MSETCSRVQGAGRRAGARIGPIEAKLNTVKPFRGIVIGAFGEVSADTHSLVKEIAAQGGRKMYALMGVGPMEAAARIKKQLVDTIGTIAARGHAQLLLPGWAPAASRLRRSSSSAAAALTQPMPTPQPCVNDIPADERRSARHDGEPSLLLRALTGDPLRTITKLLPDAACTCFRLVCAAFRDHSSKPERKCIVDFLRTRALAVFAWDRMPDFVLATLGQMLSLAAPVGSVGVLEELVDNRQGQHTAEEHARGHVARARPASALSACI
ncbi:hypothetical protein T492DRAFT_894476 [Pavlovales sp. CCMP2436]|nr:hypothetical protein T492DRAFT_894476 [Pavlovales sp. CCMP2436]